MKNTMKIQKFSRCVEPEPLWT